MGISFRDMYDLAFNEAERIRAEEARMVRDGFRKDGKPMASQVKKAETFEALARMVTYVVKGEFHRFDAKAMRED